MEMSTGTQVRKVRVHMCLMQTINILTKKKRRYVRRDVNTYCLFKGHYIGFQVEFYTLFITNISIIYIFTIEC